MFSNNSQKLNVLFVSSANSGQLSPIIQNQGNALEKSGVIVNYYGIKGKGLIGYLKNVIPLRKYINKTSPDLVHAHYALAGIVTFLTRKRPLVISLMGSDILSNRTNTLLIKYLLSKDRRVSFIAKSEQIRDIIGDTNIAIIPNGVDTASFRPLEKSKCQKELGWYQGKQHILFAASPKRKEKNFYLAKKAYNLIKSDAIELHTLNQVDHSLVPIMMNAADVVLLTSFWEGSPNVVKEAMACNRPVVATKVGDIEWLFGNEPGHYITSFDPQDVASKIQEAIKFSSSSGQTNGRNRISKLGLDPESIVKRIIGVYESLLGIISL